MNIFGGTRKWLTTRVTFTLSVYVIVAILTAVLAHLLNCDQLFFKIKHLTTSLTRLPQYVFAVWLYINCFCINIVIMQYS